MGSACTFCKKRKRKCDGNTPCSICIRYNKSGSCEYIANQDKRKFKYDTTYVDYLEMKVDLLQQLADELVRNDIFKAKSINLDLAQSNDVHFKKHDDKSEILIEDLANKDAVDELISTNWRVRQDFKGHTEFYGPVSGRQQVIEEIESDDNDDYNDNDNEFLEIKELNKLVSSDLNLKLDLINKFELNFADFFYISKLDINDIKNWSFPNSNISKQLLLCSIFTYGSIFYSNESLSAHFLKESESIILKASKDINEYYIQALLILSCYQLGMGFDSNSWTFDAMASSMTQYLKLDRLNDYENSSSSNSLFWSIVLQDRIVTSVLGRGCRIQFFRITSPYFKPILNLTDENYLNELIFANHSKLWFIYDKYLSQIYSFKAHHLHKSHKLMLMNKGIESLRKFQDLLPIELKLSLNSINNDQSCELLIFNLSYSVVILLLHRAYLKQIPLKVIQIIVQHCEIASNIISRLTNSPNPKIPYFISYLILTCATFDLFILTNKENSIKVGSVDRIQNYIDALLKFGRVWKRCYKDIKVLDELATSWKLNIPNLREAAISISHNHDDSIVEYNEFFKQFNNSSTSPFNDDDSIYSNNMRSPKNIGSPNNSLELQLTGTQNSEDIENFGLNSGF